MRSGQVIKALFLPPSPIVPKERLMNDDNKPDSVDGRLERAKDAALGAHRGPASTADEIGEAAGGISGAVLGAGVGLATGPVGAVLGGIAGALGGWWAGR